MREEIRSLGDQSWRDNAACNNPAYDGSWWFPDTGGKSRTGDKAKAICKLCPVRFPCLTYGTQHNEIGIWGGLNDTQRRNLKSVIEHKQPLICHWCHNEFRTSATTGARHLYCSRGCRTKMWRGEGDK